MRILILSAVTSVLFVLLYFYSVLDVADNAFNDHEQETVEMVREKNVRKQCRKLELAINRFHEQHGYLPIRLESDSSFDLDSPQGVELLKVLRNIERSDYPNNERDWDYLHETELAPFVYDQGFRDLEVRPDDWGGSYRVRLDGDRDLSITVRPRAAPKAVVVKGRSAVVWSNGRDPEDPSDDVTSW